MFENAIIGKIVEQLRPVLKDIIRDAVIEAQTEMIRRETIINGFIICEVCDERKPSYEPGLHSSVCKECFNRKDDYDNEG